MEGQNTNKFILEINKEELTAFYQVLDIAVKASGLSAAEAGLHLKRKLDSAKPSEDSKVE